MAVLPLVVLAVVFGYAVFRYGGVVPEDWYLCLVGVGLAFTISRLTPRNGERVPGASAVTRLLILGILAVVLVQLVPLPASVVRLVSPARVELDEAVGEVVGAAPYTAMTIVPGETFRLLLTLVGLVLVFLLVREMAWRWRDNPWILAVPFVAVAFLEAVLGLVQYYWAGTPLATGTYVNRNHFSGLLEMALPFPLMGAVAVLRAGESVRSRRSPAGPAVRACLYLGVGAVLLLAIIHSLSRMGFIAALGSFFVMGATALGAGLSGWKRTVPVILVTSLVVAGFIFLPTDQLIERFATMAATDDITADTRAQIWRDTVELIRDFPVLGCGLGCYESGFYRYKTVAPMNTVDFAHNDYLQLMAELGLAGFAILLVLGLRLFVKAMAAAGQPAGAEERYLGLACVGSLTAIALHSLVDFNLYIPANAMLLVWIAGIAEGLDLIRYRANYRPPVWLEAKAKVVG